MPWIKTNNPLVTQQTVSSLFVGFLILLSSCTVTVNDLREPAKLRSAIGESIHIPFELSDTLIYETVRGHCGNTSKKRLAKVYTTAFSFTPYWNELEENYHGDILYLTPYGTRADPKKDRALYNSVVLKHPVLSLWGETINSKSIRIFEKYELKDSTVAITKKCTYKKDSWECHVVQEESYKRN